MATQFDPTSQRLQESVPNLCDSLLLQAFQLGASDIHIDRIGTADSIDSVRLRMRLDGVLVIDRQWAERFKGQGRNLFARLKVLSGMDITEKRLPQDGSFQFSGTLNPSQVQDAATESSAISQYASQQDSSARRVIDIRVAITPTAGGEKAVLRLLRSDERYRLTDIGLHDTQMREFSAALEGGGGLILVTGPTGCGKTTTLYAALQQIDCDARSVVTIEDPVEYRLNAAAQIQIQPELEFGFSQALKSVLRQDPEVILLGEIRDVESAEIALRAAMTGHLVLSTLHSDSAQTASIRLRSMGLPNWLIEASIKLVLAQRLLRIGCKDCLNQGCSKCSFSGYKDRISVFEMLSFRTYDSLASPSDTAASLSAKGKLKTTTHQSRIGPSLSEAARELVRKGIVTSEEYRRVLGEDDSHPHKYAMSENSISAPDLES